VPIEATAQHAQPLMRCDQLRVGYRGRAILPAIDIAIGAGELWALVGRNGSGKSTWFRTLLGLLPPVAGSVSRAPGLRMSYVPQRLKLDELFPVLARDVVAMGTERDWNFVRPTRKRTARAQAALVRVGAAELADRSFRALSEGQKQRVLLARLFASEPALALLDEPTSAMDAVAERETLLLLDALRREHGTTVIVVCHALGLVREIAEHMLFFDASGGDVISGSTRDVLSHAAFHANYQSAETGF
jgi:zinc transport system ATP-binding protein